MATLIFDGLCGHRLSADENMAGQLAACAVCGRASPLPKPDFRWTCACGTELAAPEAMAAVAAPLLCVNCQAGQTLPRRLSVKRRPPPAPAPAAAGAAGPGAVPPRRADEIACRHCGYMCPSVLRRCPRCQKLLRWRDRFLAQLLKVAALAALVVAGWYLAANFDSLRGLYDSYFGSPPAAAP